MNTEQHIVEWTDKEPGPARGVGAMSDTSHTDGGVWCGWCHTVRAPHTHAVDGYRELPMPSAEAKREVIRIMLNNVFQTPTARHVHWDTYQNMSNRLFFREARTDEAVSENTKTYAETLCDGPVANGEGAAVPPSLGQWPEQPKNSPQYPVEFSFAASVPTEFYSPFAQELASAEETLAHRVRKLRSEEACEVKAVQSFESEAAEWAMRASRAKKRLQAVRDELKQLGSE